MRSQFALLQRNFQELERRIIMKPFTVFGMIAATGAAAFAGAFIGGKKAADNAQDEVLDCLETVMDDYLEAIGYYDDDLISNEDEGKSKPKQETPVRKLQDKDGYVGAVKVPMNDGTEVLLPIIREQLDFLQSAFNSLDGKSGCEGCGK